MPASAFHLAQVNIALPRKPLDAPLLRDFVASLGPVNAAAEDSPGFVWRLQTEDGDATGVRGFDDERLIVNMSLWRALEDLRAFVYARREHLEVLRRRREWFERLEAHLVLWWVPAGRLPSVAEAEQRPALLLSRGPCADAFTFRRHFPAPRAEPAPAIEDDLELCPAG